MTARNKRRRYRIIDRSVQGSLLLLTVRHWLKFLVLGFALLFLWHFLAAGREASAGQVLADVWSRYAPVFVALLALSPAYLRGLLRLSNRFVGPAYRIRKALHELATGHDPQPLTFREEDFWKDMAVSFNAILKERQALRSPPHSGGAGQIVETETEGLSQHAVV